MKGLWWKVLGVVMFIYVLIGGLTVPLGPGVTLTSPSNAKSGDTLQLSIVGYNTHFKSAGENLAWLKLDSAYILPAHLQKASSENRLELTFILPSFMPNNEKVTALNLLISNSIDGTFVQPNAIFISAKDSIFSAIDDWPKPKLNNLFQHEGLKFPFRNILNETIRNTFFHVALWFAMFVLLLSGLYHAIQYLRTHEYHHDVCSAAYNKIAIMYGVMGLVTGSIWAKFTWNTFWTTDVKLNMTAVAMLIYLAYLVLRASTLDYDKRAKMSAAYTIFAFVALIPLVFVIPRMTDSLHPGNGGNPALGGEDLDYTLRLFFYPSIIALILLGSWMSQLIIRYEKLKEKIFLTR